MQKEVERKAWVRDWDRCVQLAGQNFPLIKEYHKLDRYFSLQGDLQDHHNRFRIRQMGDVYWVTYKNKSLEGSLEVNDEVEFTVSDPIPFTQMMEALGYREFLFKEKKGLQFGRDNWLIEISHITGLGDFVEVECLLQDPDQAAVIKADHEILEIFKILEISHQDIESRYFSQLLLS